VVTGALSAAAGCGQIAAGTVLTSRKVKRHGLVFAGGAAIALAGLCAFATVPVIALAFVALIVAGTGQAGFASMQSVLAIESAAGSERGVALGVLSTAIGSLPLGMVVIGVAASQLGARPALLASAIVGLAAMLCLTLRSPELLAPSMPAGDVVPRGAGAPPALT
jgi:MFS family permease